jgi:microcystin-dependent protein
VTVAETLTANYGWTKPDPGASPNTWGATQNASLDKVDAQVFVNQQGLTPIGVITMFGGATAPDNWLLCNGQSLSTAAPYDKLFAAIGYAFGGSGANFNLPNLVQKFPLGAGTSNPLGSGGGAFPVTLATANLPVHAHPITDVGHTHGASQPAHVHPDPGHTHGVSASQDPHSHGLDHTPLTENVGGNGGAASGWGFNPTRTDSQQPAVHVTINAAATGLQAAQPAITVTPSGTGLSTTQNVGSGTPFNVVPPFVAVNFIIRFA